MRRTVDQAEQNNTRIHVRISKDGANTRYELMDGQTKLKDVSRVDLVEMVMQFASALRW